MNTEKTIIRVLRYRTSIALLGTIIVITVLSTRIRFFHPVIILGAIFAAVLLFLLIEWILRTTAINAAKKFMSKHAVSDTIAVSAFFFELQSMRELGPSIKRSLSELVTTTVPVARWHKGRVVFTREIEQYEPVLHQAVA